jgi:ankyrin repeat protein
MLRQVFSLANWKPFGTLARASRPFSVPKSKTRAFLTTKRPIFTISVEFPQNKILSSFESKDLIKNTNYHRQNRYFSTQQEQEKTNELEFLFFEAAKSGDLGQVKQLLSKGVNINCRPFDNSTPLHVAACYGHFDLVTHLISSGANVNAKNLYSDTPLHYAALFGHVKIVYHLITCKAEIDAKNLNGWTPLGKAAYAGHDEVVLCLLQNGADPKVPANNNKTAYFFAQDGGNTKLASKIYFWNSEQQNQNPASEKKS